MNFAGQFLESAKIPRYVAQKTRPGRMNFRACFVLSRVVTPASVEAAGIEPASRDISMHASTCVFDYLNLTRQHACRRAYCPAIRKQVLADCVSDVTISDPDLVTSVQG